MKNQRRAFTLIEMIAVIAIIMIIALISVPTFQALNGETRANAVELSAKSLAKDIDALAATKQMNPAALVAAGGAAADIAAFSAAHANYSTAAGNGDLTVTMTTGANTDAACITWSSDMGGASTVAEGECAVAFASSTVTGTTTSFPLAAWAMVTKQLYPAEGAPYYGFRFIDASGAQILPGGSGHLSSPVLNGNYTSTIPGAAGPGTYRIVFNNMEATQIVGATSPFAVTTGGETFNFAN